MGQTSWKHVVRMEFARLSSIGESPKTAQEVADVCARLLSVRMHADMRGVQLMVEIKHRGGETDLTLMPVPAFAEVQRAYGQAN